MGPKWELKFARDDYGVTGIGIEDSGNIIYNEPMTT